MYILQALNKVGFYQCCFNYIMMGSSKEDGEMEDPSDEYIFLIHKDSKAIKPSNNLNFKFEIDR